MAIWKKWLEVSKRLQQEVAHQIITVGEVSWGISRFPYRRQEKDEDKMWVQMFTWVRLKLYLQRKRIASPIFRKLGKLLIKWSEYRESKFRKPLEKWQSWDILCRVYFVISWFTSEWYFKEYFFTKQNVWTLRYKY